MMMPAYLALSQFVGEDKVFPPLTIYQSDGVTPQNITGWSLTFTIHAYGDPSAVFFSVPPDLTDQNGIVLTDENGISLTVNVGVTVSNPSSGQVQVAIARSNTLNMFPSQYSYSLARTNPGNYTELYYGAYTLNSA